MLYYYFDALLKIILQIESSNLSKTTVIRGSSYFLSEGNAKKFGFTVQATSTIEKLNIVLNYVDLIWMYSLSNGKLTFPDLTRIITIRTTGMELVKQKQKLLDILNRLK